MRTHVLGQRHDVAVVGVRLIQLEHRELGVVPGRHALVAEVAVDLVDALEAADHQPLQVQLRRDAQVHVDVERVVMRHERPRRGAARDRLHHRRLDLDEVERVEEVAHVADRCALRVTEHLARLRRSRSGRRSAGDSASRCRRGRATCPAAAAATSTAGAARRRRPTARRSWSGTACLRRRRCRRRPSP